VRRRRIESALIVGGSSGIGLAVAGQLAAEGCSIILAARREELLERAAAQLVLGAHPETRIATLALDASDPRQVKERLVPFLEKAGTPELLYNGAGIAVADHFSATGDDVFNDILNINLRAVWYVLKAVVPLMREAGGGQIVNVSSLSGLIGVYGYTAYSASKFAVCGLSQSLRNELESENIRVRLLCPPDTATPQLEQENLTKPKETFQVDAFTGVLSPERVARALVRNLGRRKFLIIPGFRARLSWLVYRLFPGLVHRIMDRDVLVARRQ
jgi:3-dehydrosphinganine reductase